MAKRDYFIDDDLEIFRNDEDWDKKLSGRVDFKNADKYRQGKSFQKGRTFFNLLIHDFVHYGKSELKLIIQKLAEVDYPFRLDDFKPYMGYSGAHEGFALKWLDIFGIAKEKGFDLKEMKKEIYDCFWRSEDENIISYIEKNITPIEYRNVKQMWSNLGYDDSLDSIEQMGFRPSSFLRRQDIREARQDMDTKKQRILNYLQVLNPEQLKGFVKATTPSSKRIDNYILKNELEVSLFSSLAYTNAMNPKPKQWFTSYQLRVIEVLEQKSNQTIVERIPSNPKEKLEELKKATGLGLQDIVVFNYKSPKVTKSKLP